MFINNSGFPHHTFLGLGSNLDNPLLQLQTALNSLEVLPKSKLVKQSSFYRSPALNSMAIPDFLNAVVEIETALSPHELLQFLQKIEQQQGRKKTNIRWDSRSIDIDILLYDQLNINTESLIIPHYHLAQREFVLLPLSEIAPEVILPNGETIKELLKKCPRMGTEKIELVR